ncbi:PAM68 family protein [Leptolyngbya sp. FACHB-36]|uniref:PAM68 family protein n=1 Tax=Leptolyngbya sp. FACHB-36 TaxID=2692808 RepID=UPI0016805887|nr:PAM68 family protein [Leptolyngbya sp. FACHB-36]MBD2021241.1 PAM68 family protein [Leptolyngbya sp. FACHB-36]
MPSKSNPSSNPDDAKADAAKSALPFEPTSNRKKPPKKAPAPVVKESAETASSTERAAMPVAVSRRMARRMGFFCGIPTSLGMLTFIVSYIVVTQQWFKLPNVAVVLVSMGFFGLGVLGLSYGVLSASWDEERVGSWFGWEEFTINFGRLAASWRAARQKSQP